MNEPHIPVLSSELSTLLTLKPGQSAIDATLGAGGHAVALLPYLLPAGLLLGNDVDPLAHELGLKRILENPEVPSTAFIPLLGNFSSLTERVSARFGASFRVNAIYADLGVSSMQLDRPERGFSFQNDGPLDMRMDPSLTVCAADLVRDLTEQELADLFYFDGEERDSRRIARAIVTARKIRPIESTLQLAEIVKRARRGQGYNRLHPATRTFQALRMAVNQERAALELFLQSAPELLAPCGTMAVISFHSGEDRLVKQAFKKLQLDKRFKILTKKVIRPGNEELARNPRSRSAKLRAIRRQ